MTRYPSNLAWLPPWSKMETTSVGNYLHVEHISEWTLIFSVVNCNYWYTHSSLIICENKYSKEILIGTVKFRVSTPNDKHKKSCEEEYILCRWIDIDRGEHIHIWNPVQDRQRVFEPDPKSKRFVNKIFDT